MSILWKDPKSRKTVFLNLVAHYVRVVDQAGDTKRFYFACKSFVQCGLVLNYNGFWGVDLLKHPLKNIINKYPFCIAGKAAVGGET